jgi:hypothetical protein
MPSSLLFPGDTRELGSDGGFQGSRAWGGTRGPGSAGVAGRQQEVEEVGRLNGRRMGGAGSSGNI